MAGRSRRAPRRGRLPIETTSFHGRERELAEIRRWLSSARLITLTGTGGAGKTRLAIRAAAGFGRAFADGAWLVDVGALRDPELLDHQVATTLGIRDSSDRPLREVLVDH